MDHDQPILNTLLPSQKKDPLFAQKYNIYMKNEKTLVIIKPDGIQRNLIAEVIMRYERLGFKMIASKMLHATPKMIREHYSIDPLWGQKAGEKVIAAKKEKGENVEGLDPLKLSVDIVDRLALYMTNGPVLAMVWQGAHVVQIVRKITGSTEPRSSDVGTIRGDFMIDSYDLSNLDKRALRNIVHASSSVEEAEKEIPIWFQEEEVCEYSTPHDTVLYDPTF
jgi:nucleoside-diphosphate kinase